MTLSTLAAPRAAYATDGVTTAFPTGFPFFGQAEFTVVLVDGSGNETTQRLNGDYSVTGGGGQAGTVTFAAPPAAGMTLVVYRLTNRSQLTDLEDNANMPAAALEVSFDRGVALLQEDADLATRTLRGPIWEASVLALPPAAQRAGKALYFDNTGNPVPLATAGLPPVVFPDFNVASVTATGSTTTRLVRDRFAETVDVRDFGAAGDGITDDTAAIQAAVNAAAHRPVYFSAGSYLTSAPIAINAIGLKLLGDGPSSTFLLPSGSFAAVLAIGGAAADIDCRDMTINTQGHSTRCVTLAIGSQAIRFNNVEFQGSFNGALVYSQCAGFLMLTDCAWYCATSATIGWALDGYNQNTAIQGGRAGGSGTFGEIVNTTGNPANGVQGTLVHGLHTVCTGPFGIIIGQDSYLTQVSDCVIDQQSSAAILVTNGAALVTITGNWLGLAASASANPNSTAMAITASAGTSHQIDDNVFFGGAINLSIQASSTQRTGAVRITNNTFQVAAQCSLSMDSVNGCIVEANQELSAPATGSWATIASHPSRGAYNFGNNSWTATPTNVDVSSSYRAAPDRGPTLCACGNIGSGSGSSVTFAHGLLMAPDIVLVTVKGATPVSFGATVSGGNITINYSPAGACVFSWEAKVYH